MPPLCVFAVVFISLAYGYPQTDFHHFPLEDFLSSHESTFEDKSNLGQDRDTHSFFPSFSPFEPPPLGHSRPFLFQPDGAFSQKPKAPQNELNQGGLRKQFNKDDATTTPRLGLLGSGNFGVIRGGTFYNDHDGEGSDLDYQYRSFYHNGHGRPAYHPSAQNPKPQRQQFANFRDFADINTPSYSQYVVVYSNPNDSASNKDEKVIGTPKNIIEQLAMLDAETTTATEQVPPKKLSKSKLKLAKLLPEKKWKAKSEAKSVTTPPSDLPEPMLALS